MKKIRLKKKHVLKFNKTNTLLWVLFTIVIAVFLAFNFINNRVSPILFNYAELQARKLASIIINRAVSKQLTEGLDMDELFIITKDSSGEIKAIDFNPIIVNKALTLITNSVQLNLKYIEEGKIDLLELPSDILIDYDASKLKKGIIYEIPSGIVFQNALLNNIGPKIPVKFSLIGDITSNVVTKVTNYGINNAMIEVRIKISVHEQVILPLTSKRILVENEIPVSLKLIQGTVPNYYFNGIDKNSNALSIPIE